MTPTSLHFKHCKIYTTKTKKGVLECCYVVVDDDEHRDDTQHNSKKVNKRIHFSRKCYMTQNIFGIDSNATHVTQLREVVCLIKRAVNITPNINSNNE